MNNTVKRNTQAVCCPVDNGYCERVDCTPEEIKIYQTCGRSYTCCIAAFVCKICKARIVKKLHAPEYS